MAGTINRQERKPSLTRVLCERSCFTHFLRLSCDFPIDIINGQKIPTPSDAVDITLDAVDITLGFSKSSCCFCFF